MRSLMVAILWLLFASPVVAQDASASPSPGASCGLVFTNSVPEGTPDSSGRVVAYERKFTTWILRSPPPSDKTLMYAFLIRRGVCIVDEECTFTLRVQVQATAGTAPDERKTILRYVLKSSRGRAEGYAVTHISRDGLDADWKCFRFDGSSWVRVDEANTDDYRTEKTFIGKAWILVFGE